MSRFFRLNPLLKTLVLVLVFVFSLELILRGVGAFLLLPSEKRNNVFPEDSKKLRILAIGESTTADYYSDEVDAAWPRQLEALLQKQGINARVYNEGIPATETSYIVSKIYQHLDTYKPHIVISMMGANDKANGLKFDGSPKTYLMMKLHRLRVLRLIRWIVEKLHPDLSCNFSNEQPGPDDAPIIKTASELAVESPPPVVETHIRNYTQDDHRVALILKSVAINLKGKNVSWIETDAHRPFIDRAFDLFPHNSSIASFTLEFKSDRNRLVNSITRERYIEVKKKLLACANHLPSFPLISIARVVEDDEQKVESAAGFTFLNDRKSYFAYHYKLFSQYIRESGAELIAMQYPTLPLRDLQNIFKDSSGQIENRYQNIYFVSNEENFKNALSITSYEQLFTDRFGGTWGHATGKGNRLIAESAMSGVISLIKTNPKLKSFNNQKPE